MDKNFKIMLRNFFQVLFFFIFSFSLAANPPVANFSANPTVSCTGIISFTDLSTGGATSWLWNFGDGNTSTLKNPTHTYQNYGVYTVSLTATNSSGSDIKTVAGFITVEKPKPASCTPQTQNGTLGFGITNFKFHTIDHNSGNSSEGYKNFTCQNTKVFATNSYAISAVTSTPAQHNVRVWIDYNNDGIFDNTNELVFSANNVLNATGTVTIPATAVLNTPLRLRISADYNLSPIPTPCSNLEYGQAEDYTVIIQTSNAPPVADFKADNTTTCDGIVNFTDLSSNQPVSWLWNFGDGNTSALQFPTHTYNSSGTYSVSLTATNSLGNHSTTKTNYITVNKSGQVTSPVCTPQTQGYCCGYGIYRLIFGTINNATANASEGYQDFSCSHTTIVFEGEFYPVSLQTNPNEPQDTRIWIDLNNDGNFSSNEMIFESINKINPSGSIHIPGGAVKNTPLRMRVSSDFAGSNLGACSNPTFGQVEDYGIIIQTNTSAPVANFKANKTFFCNDTAYFTDLSTGLPSSWLWNFGDGSTSSQKNPKHYYKTPGVYDVTLEVSNSNGTHSEIFKNYIRVNTGGCDTVRIPGWWTGPVQTACTGFVTDDGGMDNYSHETHGTITISPSSGNNVMLTFHLFDFEEDQDFLNIYDGPNTSSPMIGSFTGNQLPHGGVIISSGKSLTLEQITDFWGTRFGFLADWSCYTSVTELEKKSAFLNAYPNPATSKLNIYFVSENGSLNGAVIMKNMLGEMVYQSPIEQSTGIFKETIDVSGLAKGIYLLIINNGANQTTRKIILQ